MATYAVGDLQGCYDELQKLLDRVGFTDEDELWLAGDLVNRGPESLKVLRFVKDMGSRVRCVLGNHDLHLLALHFDIGDVRKHETLRQVLEAPDREELMHWLLQQPLMVEDTDKGYVMTHAGIPHIWDLKSARQYADEISQLLRSSKPIKFFKHMYGNSPNNWSAELKSWPRYRVITNYFTRMRFIAADGTLDFHASGGLDTQPEGFLPWFAQPRQQPLGATQLFGHWAALDPSATGNAVTPVVALDTGCVWGNKLTCMRLEDGKIFSCGCDQYRNPA